MKFKLWDKVRVVVQPEGARRNLVGCTGTIVDIDEDWVFPYEVAYDDESIEDTDICLFDDGFLEPIKNKDNTSFIESVGNSHAIPYFSIQFQNGTVEENGRNGYQVEEIIDILVERLEGFQKGNHPCRENALAITKLEEARMWLNERTRKRKEQGVEGKHESHE